MTGPAPCYRHYPGRADAVDVRPDLHRQRRIRPARGYIRLIYRNLLAAGEPGGGKSGLLNTLTAHAALSVNSRLVLFDGKQVELGMWDDIADEFVGPDLDHAIITLLRLQKRDGQPVLLAARPPPPQDRTRRRHHPSSPRSSTRSPCTPPCWAPSQQEDCSSPCSATWWPAAAPPPCPSSPPPSGPRWTSSPRACATCSATAPRSAAPPPAAPTSSSATAGPKPDSPPPTSAPSTTAKRFLIAEGGIPQRIKVAYLSDADITALADYAAWTRRADPAPRPLAAGPAIAVA